MPILARVRDACTVVAVVTVSGIVMPILLTLDLILIIISWLRGGTSQYVWLVSIISVVLIALSVATSLKYGWVYVDLSRLFNLQCLIAEHSFHIYLSWVSVIYNICRLFLVTVHLLFVIMILVVDVIINHPLKLLALVFCCLLW